MKNDGESRKFFHYSIQYFECQRRRNHTTCSRINVTLFRSKFVCTVRSTDRDSQWVATCTSCKINYFFRVSISMMIRRNFIFHTGQYTQFTFYSYIKLMSVVNHLLCQSYVFFIRQMRTVDHYRRETWVDTALASFESISVVQMKNDFRFCTT